MKKHKWTEVVLRNKTTGKTIESKSFRKNTQIRYNILFELDLVRDQLDCEADSIIATVDGVECECGTSVSNGVEILRVVVEAGCE